MLISTNTENKIKKMVDGKTFGNPLVFITEFIQNSYRAKAKELRIDIVGDTITFTDNGCGCSNPENILTFEFSEWESTTEGFGIGFWSWLALPNANSCTVKSGTWKADISVEKLLSGDLSIDIEKSTKFKGFSVSIKSEYLDYNEYGIVDEIRNVAELQQFNVFLNGSLIAKKDILGSVRGDFTQDFETPLFTARLCVNDTRYSGYAQVYYEKRYVSYLNAKSCRGNIELKSNALNLREPDRTSWVADDKEQRLENTLARCEKQLFLAFIENATDEQLHEYAAKIDLVLSPKEYAPYLRLDESIASADTAATTEESRTASPVFIVTDTENYTNDINEDEYERDDTSHESTISVKNSPKRDNLLVDVVSSSSKLRVYMGASEMDNYSKLKSEAEYYGVKVFIAKNLLYVNSFKMLKIPHISELSSNITKKNIITATKIKNTNEKSFLGLLHPICVNYNLPEDTFLIGNVSLEVKTYLKNRLINTETQKVGAVCTGDNSIIFDRTHLELDRFNPIEKETKYKVLMTHLKLISHELSHLLYCTSDNTIEHYQVEEIIYNGLTKLYC